MSPTEVLHEATARVRALVPAARVSVQRKGTSLWVRAQWHERGWRIAFSKRIGPDTEAAATVIDEVARGLALRVAEHTEPKPAR